MQIDHGDDMTIEADVIPPDAKPQKGMDFTDDIFDEICDRMTNGKGLREICNDPDMPTRQTFLRWVEKDTGRQARYQQAREALMDWYSEEILAIAWDDSKDTIKGKDGEPKCNHEWINRSRLKVDTLKFLMAKLHPKRYGDKLTPEAEDAKVAISWEEPKRIERIIVEGVRAAPDGVYEELQERIRDLEEQLGLREDAGPPKLLTYNPGPLPASIDPVILSRVVSLIRDCVPEADSRPADEVLAEVESVCRTALESHYQGL